MQRLSADLIVNSRAFYNPLKERQLDLRGYKLIVIENLGAMQDQFDTLDLSDNEIKKMDNFPRMNRLRTVLLSNNHITRLDARVGRNLVRIYLRVSIVIFFVFLAECSESNRFSSVVSLGNTTRPSIPKIVLKQKKNRLLRLKIYLIRLLHQISCFAWCIVC